MPLSIFTIRKIILKKDSISIHRYNQIIMEIFFKTIIKSKTHPNAAEFSGRKEKKLQLLA